jgi:hypothetical protein
MKIATSELTGSALDWATAKAEGNDYEWMALSRACRQKANYSTDWSQGGPIIEKGKHGAPGNRMEFRQGNIGVYASYWRGPTYHGPTHLVAAMRCFVAAKLGDEIDVPDELLAPVTPAHPAARRPRI